MTKQIKDKQSASMPKHDMSELVRREYVNFINTTYKVIKYQVLECFTKIVYMLFIRRCLPFQLSYLQKILFNES